MSFGLSIPRVRWVVVDRKAEELEEREVVASRWEQPYPHVRKGYA